MLEAVAVPAYTTDPAGRIIFFNNAAEAFWGRRPELGVDRWSGALRLYRTDGLALRREDCPLALLLNGGEPAQGMEAVMERPDGSRVTFKEYPGLLRDPSGEVVGAVNLLIDVSAAADADISAARLAAIVSSSDDAIISKTLEGRITSWNAGARRIFGYEAEEIIGQSILRIIPPELHGEEDEILSKLRRGQRIDHYDTVRVTKDGRRVDISLTVSPVRDSRGNIVGASKVARDVSERKRSETLQRLLFQELNHRVKNTLAMVASLAQQSLRTAPSADDFAESFTGRVQALAART